MRYRLATQFTDEALELTDPGGSLMLQPKLATESAREALELIHSAVVDHAPLTNAEVAGLVLALNAILHIDDIPGMALVRAWLAEHDPNAVFVVTEQAEDGTIRDMEMLSTMPTFPLSTGMTVRLGNLNGGGSIEVARGLSFALIRGS